MGKAIIVFIIFFLIMTWVYAANYDFFYNPYTVKLDRSLSLNQTGFKITISNLTVLGNLNLTGNAFGIYNDENTSTQLSRNLSVNMPLGWTNLTNYPVACPTGNVFVTQLEDSITCTTLSTADFFSNLNYSAEYSSTGYKIINFTDEYARSGWKIGNMTSNNLGSALSNNTMARFTEINITGRAGFNATIWLANISIQSNGSWWCIPSC